MHGYKNLNVMIIDDDDFQVEVVAERLIELGFSQFIKADGGQSGLRHFDDAPIKPDLLICDIQMPDLDGFEFIKAMGERNYLGGVILMSGQGARVLYSAALLAQLSQQNFLGTIEKPVQIAALTAAIAKLRAPVKP